MPEIHVKRIGSGYSPLIEDPQLSNNRLFISTVGHDTTTLAPLFQRNFHFQFNDSFLTSAADTDDWGFMYLEKGTIQCWSSSDQNINFDNNSEATYHVSLDPTFFPVKRAWRTINNRIVTNIQPTRSTTERGANDARQHLYPTTDWTVGAGAAARGAAVAHITHYCYEDVSNNRLWGLSMGGGTGDLWFTQPNYESVTTGQTSITPPQTTERNFFCGVDDLGFITGVSVSDTNSLYSQYSFYRIHPTTFAVTTLVTTSSRGATNRVQPKSWPSNLRRASATRRVIYSCHYTTAGNLEPIRYVWNPADGSVAVTNCTIVYPGSNTYSTYSAMYSTEGNIADNRVSWHMKGYQFTVDGVNYITFWLTDKFAHANSGPSRWNTALKRTMMTYTIGAGTGDEVLTFHSSYTFPTINDIPRDFMPINAAGTQLMVPVTLQMRFFSFNTSTGWAPTGTYPYEFRQVGLDQTNRIWGFSREKGQGVLHFITPTIPVTINVVMASTNFTFTGAPISTSCTVDAFGADGLRISTSVNLAIDGNTMVFTTNNTKNLTVSTSASASTVVNLTITGGGINNIIASVDI
jgi:hypothetical protein